MRFLLLTVRVEMRANNNGQLEIPLPIRKAIDWPQHKPPVKSEWLSASIYLLYKTFLLREFNNRTIFNAFSKQTNSARNTRTT